MSLPPSSVARKLKHTRSVNIEVYHREDGLWEIDARLIDTKTHDIALTCGLLPAGKPIHDLWLRIVIDDHANIVNAEAVSDAVPFSGHCEIIGDIYKKLIGLNLLSGFRNGVRERLSGVEGCTHLNELALILPTAAIQTLSFNDVIKRSDPGGSREDKKPFELDSCHALRSDGAAVALYYPRWAEKPNT